MSAPILFFLAGTGAVMEAFAFVVFSRCIARPSTKDFVRAASAFGVGAILIASAVAIHTYL